MEISACALFALVCLMHQKQMNAGKCLRSPFEVKNFKVSDLCRIKEFHTASKQIAFSDQKYREEQSEASGSHFRKTCEGGH